MFTKDDFYLEPRQDEDLSLSKISDDQGDLRGCPVRSEQLPYGAYQCLHSDPTYIPTDYSPTTAQPTPFVPVYIPTGDAAALSTPTPFPTGWSFDKEVGVSYANLPHVWGQVGEACSDYAGNSNHDYLSTDMNQGCGYLPGFLGYSSHSTPESAAWSDLSQFSLQPSPTLERHQPVGAPEGMVLQEGPRKSSTGTRSGNTTLPLAGSELMLCPRFPQACVGKYESDAETKPPFSYITLIASAIMSAKDQRATLSEIYAWIMLHFAYYRRNIRRWQNSIRHALSFNDCFTRVPRPSGETGKGSYWTLHSGALGMFENGSSIRRNRKFVDESRVRRTYTARVLRSPTGAKLLAPPLSEGTAGNGLAALLNVGLAEPIDAGEQTFSSKTNDSSLFNKDIPEPPQPGTANFSTMMPAVSHITDPQMN